jgi:hypothetical protein
MNKIVTFKWKTNLNTWLPSRDPRKISGIDYDANYVNNHFNSIKDNLKEPFEYICITDNPEGLSEEITVIPLWDHCREIGGCTTRLFIFSKDFCISEKFMLLDLDTTIHGDFSELFHLDEDLCCFYSNNPEHKESKQKIRYHLNCSIIDNTKYNFIWESFYTNPKENLTKSRKYFTGTDQSWLNYLVLKNNLKIKKLGSDYGLYEARSDNIIKKRRIPDNAKIIQWSGPRDPNQFKSFL